MIIGVTMMFQTIIFGHQRTEDVKHFTYLGSLVDKNGKVEADVKNRIRNASLTFQRLHSIWSMSTISLRTKIHMCNTCYACQTTAFLDGNELDTTKREEEKRQARQNMVCNIKRRLTTG